MQHNRIIQNSRTLLLGATAMFGGCIFPMQAAAQSDLQGSAPANATDDEGTHVLDTIFVTAEKRSENLQNVPIAITAVTGETLEKAGVNEVGDLTQLTPSLQFGTRSSHVFIAMRGVVRKEQSLAAMRLAGPSISTALGRLTNWRATWRSTSEITPGKV